jgi:hypothetical protein
MYNIDDKVWVKCVGSDAWVQGVVVGNTAKRVKVFNEARGLEGLYAPQNVKERV